MKRQLDGGRDEHKPERKGRQPLNIVRLGIDDGRTG